MKKILFLISLLGGTLYAQDQLKIMYYNLLNFPSSTPQRVDTLKKIVQHELPDVFVVNELESNAGANSILNDALNQYGITYYQKAAFVNGPDTDNMLFYNSDKLVLSSQQKISTVLRDINEYVLYYKDPNLGQETDTIFFYFYSLHLKAGSDQEAQRNIECTTLRNFLDARTTAENVFVGGDFNFYTSAEPGYSTLVNSTVLELKDPVFSTGEWHNNSAFKGVHTQSTRTTALADGSGGGMDDRFDFIFVSDDVLSGINAVDYVNNSYTAMGQDGIRLNQSINNPTNTILPADIARALYYMSDHLPVIMEVDVNYASNSVQESTKISRIYLYYNSSDNSIKLSEDLTNYDLKIINIKGQVVYDAQNLTGDLIQLSESLSSGVYICQLKTEQNIKHIKFVIQ